MASSKPESRLIKAAGTRVAWRPGPDGRPEILLVHRKKYDDWSLPKGKVEPGETLPVTAVREVLEEGGARLALGRRLASIRYNVGGRPKRVHYWSAAVASLDDHAVPNDEVDAIEWADADHAVERVSYRHDHGVLADFARLPARTVPIILLRHAKAMGQSSWKRADDRRPLDETRRPRRPANTLGRRCSLCFGPTSARLITSPAARCVETLRPFAELSGAEELREEPSTSTFTTSHPERTRPTPRRPLPPSSEATVTQASATIFCAHRENIPVTSRPPAPGRPSASPSPLGRTAPGSAPSPTSASRQFPELPSQQCPGRPPPANHPRPPCESSTLALSPPPASGTQPNPQRLACDSAASQHQPHPPAPPAPSSRPAWRRWFRARTRLGAPHVALPFPPPLRLPAPTPAAPPPAWHSRPPRLAPPPLYSQRLPRPARSPARALLAAARPGPRAHRRPGRPRHHQGRRPTQPLSPPPRLRRPATT